ncbi:MAG: hypothetical protein HY689_12495 [Chloroflexi bacterium]|nr:hypothetical protein [Chloroflexota bacterium]
MPHIDLWSLVLPALVMGLFAFTVLRQRGPWSLTLRVLGGVRLSRGGPSACPHLGMTDDPFAHRDAPSEEHRCYLWMQRDRIDLTHQKGFCLSPAHTYCPWLSIRPAAAPTPLYRRLPALAGQHARRVAATAAPVLQAWLRAAAAALAHAVAWGWRQARTVWLPALTGRIRAVLRWALRQAARAEDTLRTYAAAVGPSTAQARDALGGRVHRLAGVLGAGVARSWASLRRILAHTAAWPGRTAARLRPRRARPAALALELARQHGPEPGAAAPHPAPATSQRPASAVAGAGQPLTPGAPAATESLQRLLEQAKLAGMAGNRRQAHAHFVFITELAPDHEEAWLWRAAMASNNDEKRTCLERALALNPASTRARSGLEDFLDALQPAPTAASAPPSSAASLPDAPLRRAPDPAAAGASPPDLVARGLAELEAGREDAAYGWFVQATTAFPQDSRAWFWRAKTAAELTEVVTCLGHALAADPDNEQVQANFAWAMERLEREQQRGRFGQPFSPEEGHAALARSRQRPAPPARSPVAQVRSGLSEALRWAAGMACLALAGYWLLAALAPVLPAEALPLPAAAREVVGSLPSVELTGPEPLQDLLPGYRLLAGLPPTLAFLALFAGLGLLQRQGWSPPWALALALITVGLALTSGAHTLAAPLATLLSGLVALGWLTNRRAFARASMLR